MSIIQNISQKFSTYAQTTDKHTDSDLVTRYYKANLKQAMEAVKEVASTQKGYQIKSVQEERGEIGITITKPKRALMVVTVTTVRPYRTAIDFSISTDSKLAFGFGKKTILQMYQQLNEKLTYLSTGSN